MKKLSRDEERIILTEVQENLKLAIEEDRDNRKNALEDLEFVAVEDAQWPSDVKAMRVSDRRPCITVNKMPAFISQVVGDQRLNRPSIKVVPVDDKGDPQVAETLSGWIKNVQNRSNADIVYDHGFEHAVTCGYGAMRVITDYVDDTSFNQDAYIEKIDNALSVYWGKHSKYDCSDAEHCIIITDMLRGEYKEKYKKDPVPFNSGDSRFVKDWATKDTVRVAEYFKKVHSNKTIYLLEDGRVVDKLEEGDVKDRSREVQQTKIMWYLVSGDAVLEYSEWVGKKYIPVVPIWGKELNVGGERVITSLIRNAKDSQRMFNYWSSVDTEVIAMQPRVPFIVTAGQIKGYETMWKESQNKNFPYLVINPDKEAPGWPKREAPPQASGAMLERLQNTDQEMRDTIGLQKASLGMKSNERSGKAIIERKREGDVGTFSFADNLSRSVKQLGRILVDIAPGILDTERVIRLGLDNGENKPVTVNQEVKDVNGVVQRLNAPGVGEYDVVVATGPSFSTQRTEARESMAGFIQYYPNAAPLIGDLFAKNMDWPDAEEVAERLEYLLPPEVRAEKNVKRAEKNGQPPPEQQQQQPSPEEVFQMESNKVELKTDEVKLEQENVELQIKQVQLNQEKAKLAEMSGKLVDDQDNRMKGRLGDAEERQEKEV
jgi:hypothetical protein